MVLAAFLTSTTASLAVRSTVFAAFLTGLVLDDSSAQMLGEEDKISNKTKTLMYFTSTSLKKKVVFNIEIVNF